MTAIPLRLAGEKRAYKILVGSDLLDRAAALCRDLGSRHAFVIADSGLKAPRTRLVQALEKGGWRVDTVELRAGESTKDVRRAFQLYGDLLGAKADRASVVFALGGGVIGDLAGYVAATYWRGIRWVGVPTTLLAQVDSSIGGKTGVNHPLGKNLIGAIHQPSLVLCDTSVLRTLTLRDRASGLAEAIKYGLIFDPAFFRYLNKNLEAALALEPAVIHRTVATSAKWKAKVVGQDERETRGLRYQLNFGHTLGHALEAATGFKRFRHGEAIAWGMRWATALSVERGHLAASVADLIDESLARLPVPPLPKALRLDDLLPYLKRDKKVEAGKLSFVLLDRLGHARLDRGVRERDLRAAWRRV